LFGSDGLSCGEGRRGGRLELRGIATLEKNQCIATPVEKEELIFIIIQYGAMSGGSSSHRRITLLDYSLV